ncbi:hypothetical protein Tco_1550033, partial [Tanacetum coccineum]
TRRVPHEKYIEINAPYALSLTINWKLALTKLSLLNVSSLIRAELDYRQPGRFYNQKAVEMLEDFLQNLRHVKELTIGKTCSWILDHLKAKESFNQESDGDQSETKDLKDSDEGKTNDASDNKDS